MARLDPEALELGKKLFHEYLYHSRIYFTDPERNERVLKAIDWKLADLGLAITVIEEETEEHDDAEHGIEILTMPAYLATINAPVEVLDNGTLVHTKPSDSLPTQITINRFDINFLQCLGIDTRI